MAKEFITKDDIDATYMTSSQIYELINGVKPSYTTVGSNGYVTLPGGITFEWGECVSNIWITRSEYYVTKIPILRISRIC